VRILEDTCEDPGEDHCKDLREDPRCIEFSKYTLSKEVKKKPLKETKLAQGIDSHLTHKIVIFFGKAVKMQFKTARKISRTWKDSVVLTCCCPMLFYIYIRFSIGTYWLFISDALTTLILVEREGHASMVEELKKQLPSQPAVIAAAVGGGGLIMGVLLGIEKCGWKQNGGTAAVGLETTATASFHESYKAKKVVGFSGATNRFSLHSS
jgi:hypothetical protein